MLKIITEKRKDAIGIYNRELFRAMRNGELVEIDNKNILSKLLGILKIPKEGTLLFTDVKAIKIISAFFLKNKKYAVVMHLDKDPYFFRFIPFLTMKKLLQQFDGIICISEFSKSQVKELGINAKVAYCGVNHNLFKPAEEKIIKEKYILYVGNEIPIKNMKNLLEAFSILKKDFKDLKLVKVGNPDSLGLTGNREKTLEYIKEFNLQDDVIFTGFVKDEDLPKYYSGAELSLFLPLLSGFGLPIAEAMACGCPVVTSDRNPMKEIVGKTQLTADPLNPKEIAEKCKEVLQNKELQNRMRKEGIKRAELFDWNRTARKIMEAIRWKLQ